MHPLLASFPVVFEQVVDWGDMDGFAHVNNVVYFRYFENVRIEYLQRIRWNGRHENNGNRPHRCEHSGTISPTRLLSRYALGGSQDSIHRRRSITLNISLPARNQMRSRRTGRMYRRCLRLSKWKKWALPAEIRERINQLERKG